MLMVTKSEAYQNLANAIIVQAAKDYVNGYKRRECLGFFRSQWYKELTDIPPHVIIKECERRVEENRKRLNHTHRSRGVDDD